MAVCAHAPSADLIQQLVAGLTQEAMTWPVRGLALHGPPAHELVAPIPRRWLLDALGDGLAKHAANEPALHQSVLNAGRARRFAAEGVWSSKDAAAGWVLARTNDPGLVQASLAIRHGDGSRTLDPARVNWFVRRVQARVQQAAAREPDQPRQPSHRGARGWGGEGGSWPAGT